MTCEKFSGAEWLERSFNSISAIKGKTLSLLARKVADILGQVYKGLYHLSHIHNQDWFDSHGVHVYINSDLSTFDGSELTNLVLLCHEHAIRLSINTGFEIYKYGEGYPSDLEDIHFDSFKDSHNFDLDYLPARCRAIPCLKLNFYQRSHDGKNIYSKHPTIEQAVETARNLGECLKDAAAKK